ncbi:MAG: ABC transporter ATP-binding protein [Betaproteobacteria bacterium]|nr:ABC transporter ATP-binding protein [Betaproteobacteria bacterium]
MLSLERVSARYGAFQALFDVSLQVNAGESVAVIGPNGAGKTTLLRVISKLVEPHDGELRFESEDLNPVPAHEVLARGIAHVPENRRLFPRLTVEENLRMGGFPRFCRPRFAERLEVAYALFPRLKERRRQPAGTLSGGEQQMCAIARALMSDPKLLLLDEPSAGLSPVMVQAIFELVRRICAEGYTVLIVEQNIRQVLKVASRAYLLDAGRIKAKGPSQELLQSEEIRRTYLGL